MSDMKENLELLSRSLYRLPVAELTDEQLHAVVARAVLARLQPAWQGSLQAHCTGRRAYYFSAEYLLGKAVYNNLLCTGLTGEVEAALTAASSTSWTVCRIHLWATAVWDGWRPVFWTAAPR